MDPRPVGSNVSAVGKGGYGRYGQAIWRSLRTYPVVIRGDWQRRRAQDLCHLFGALHRDVVRTGTGPAGLGDLQEIGVLLIGAGRDGLTISVTAGILVARVLSSAAFPAGADGSFVKAFDCVAFLAGVGSGERRRSTAIPLRTGAGVLPALIGLFCPIAGHARLVGFTRTGGAFLGGTVTSLRFPVLAYSIG